MGKHKLLDSDDEHSNDDLKLTINKDYAHRYNNWRQKEELQKLKNKYGDDVEDDEESESTDGEVEWDAEDECDFLRTLGALKSNDPKIYQKDVKFFDASRERRSRQKVAKKPKREEKMTIRDYEQKLVTERGGQFSEDEDEEQKPSMDASYYEKEKQLKDEFKKALGGGSDSDEDDNLLKKRVKSKEEVQKEEDEYYDWLSGRKQLDNVDSDLANLKKTWQSNELSEEDKFLRDYLLNKNLPTYDEIVEVDNELEKTDHFEVKYNFRFEDPDQEFIKQYPRTVKESLRREDTRRKDARDRVKERKDEEKRQKTEEIKQLKSLKRQEIEEKLRKLKRITKEDIPISVEDLQKDFDPAEYDRKMREAFSNDYYGKDDDEKPVFSDMSDMEDEEDDEGEENVAVVDDVHEDLALRQRREKISSRRNKRNTKFNEVVKRKKPLFNPDEKTFEEYFNEFYALDYEDIIADNLKTKFKYRTVEANDFGLSTDEILNLDDKQLNAWVSVKKVTAYRSPDEEKMDRVVYQRKAQNPEKKKKVFKSVVLPTPKKKSVASPEVLTQPESTTTSASSKKNKKKRKSRMELSKNRLKAYGVSTTKLKSHLNKDKYKKKSAEPQ